MLWICLALLAIAANAALELGDTGTIAGMSGETIAIVVAMSAFLIYIASAAIAGYRGRLTGAARDLAIWLGLVLVLVAAYSFREEAGFVVNRVAGELLPPGQAVNVGTAEPGRISVRIRKRRDGHFVARARVNGAPVGLLIDTGATSVMLTPGDARAAGINVDNLSYTTPIQTANGSAYAASVHIDKMEVGAIIIRNVDALVAKPGQLRESLLGMSFLSRLRSFEFSPDFITLRSG
jgi:aspartyl protease family protein